MDIYVAKILVEDVDANSCSVHLFHTFEEAWQFADKEIDAYGMEYEGNVVERTEEYFSMHSWDTYVTIQIEKHKL